MIAAAGMLGMLVLGAGVAVADGVTLPFPGDANTINGCYSSGGALKVLTPSAPTCTSGYMPIDQGRDFSANLELRVNGAS